MIEIVTDAWPAAKLAVPEGNTPLGKSFASSGWAPVPLNAQSTVPGWEVSPLRQIVKFANPLPN